MSKIEAAPYNCNVCQASRAKDYNKWFVLVTNASLDAVTTYHWQDNIAAMSGAAHACGRDHAVILFTRWMDHGTFDEHTVDKPQSV